MSVLVPHIIANTLYWSLLCLAILMSVVWYLSLIVSSKNMRQSECPSIGEWMDKLA